MLYILHGPDDFSRAEKIAELKASLGDPTVIDMNLTVLEGGVVTLNDIRRQADAMPFLAAKRVVIVTDYIKNIGSKKDAVQALTDYFQHLSPSTDLVLAESDALRKGSVVLKAAQAVGAEIILYGELSSQNLPGWIIQRVKAHGAAIEPVAAQTLARLVGADLRVLNNEIEKLVLYADGQRPISKADVDSLVPYIEEADQFGFSNAIGRRNARQAYDQLYREIEVDGKHPMQILASIASQMRTLIEFKDMAEQGMSPADMARVKGWKSDYAVKMRLRDASNFTMSRLEQIMEILLETDLAIKTGKMEMGLALDVFVARLCARK